MTSRIAVSRTTVGGACSGCAARTASVAVEVGPVRFTVCAECAGVLTAALQRPVRIAEVPDEAGRWDAAITRLVERGREELGRGKLPADGPSPEA